MAVNRDIRRGIVGAASIASGQFLPGLREASGGRAVLVGSRARARTNDAETAGTENAAPQISASTISPGSRPDHPLRNQYDLYRGYSYGAAIYIHDYMILTMH